MCTYPIQIVKWIELEDHNLSKLLRVWHKHFSCQIIQILGHRVSTGSIIFLLACFQDLSRRRLDEEMDDTRLWRSRTVSFVLFSLSLSVLDMTKNDVSSLSRLCHTAIVCNNHLMIMMVMGA